MNKKLICRILGALASALIIVSVFVPFVSVKGHTASLWQTFSMSKALYLPIMLIIFGAIGVIFFSLNIKTEFAYISTGAVSFFVIMQTIDIVNQGVFNTLSVGYYFLAIGAILTGVMAFLLNLKQKQVEITETINNDSIPQDNVINQIDKLYNEQPTPEIAPIQAVDNVVAPIQPIASIPVESIQPLENLENKSIPEPQISTIPEVSTQNVNPVIQEFNTAQSIDPVAQPTTDNVTPNPVVQEFGTDTQTPIPEVPSQSINPVVQEFENNQQTSVPNSQAQGFNPVVQEFSNPVVNEVSQPEAPQPVSTEPIPLQQINGTPDEPVQTNNPVVQEFTNPNAAIISQNSGAIETDIFGQPINR